MRLSKEKNRVVDYSLLGYGIIGGSMLATLIIWFTTLASYNFIVQDPFLFFSKIMALTGTMGMCWTFILATRLPLLENVFAGLDKVYHVHKNIGKLSYGLIAMHIVFQFLRFVPPLTGVFDLFAPNGSGPVAWGVYAFLLFSLLIAFTLWIPLPYHIWKRTHELFIVVLALAFLHIYITDKQVNASPLLSFWLYGWIGLAVASYIYIRFLYWYLGPRYTYTIQDIQKIRQTWNVSLRPADDVMQFLPGQFVYIIFDNEKLGFEAHPYSISSRPHEEYMRVSIKNLGDYTSQLDALKVGQKAIMYGPYGRFYEKYLYEKNKDAILIAGGIGITPFLSMLAYEAHHPSKRKTYVFYCVKSAERADYETELVHYAARNPNIIINPHYTKDCGFLTIAEVKKEVGTLTGKNIFLCGPKPMMDSFIKQCKKGGVKNCNIVYEDFNLLD